MIRRVLAARLLRPLLGLFVLLALAASRVCLGAADGDLKPVTKESFLSGRLGAMGIIMVGEQEHLRAVGSGFLVSACHVLTAGHVLAREGGKPRRGMAVRFVPALGNHAVGLTERAVWGDVVAAGEDFVSKGSSPEFDVLNATRDWALIELERPLPSVEPFKMLYPEARLENGTPMSAVGYAPSPHLLYLNAHERCGVRPGFHGADWLPGVLIVDCAVRTGMSGGPLLLDGGAQLIAAGVMVERVEVGERIVAVAVAIRAFADKIAPVMQASAVCPAGQPFVLPPRGKPEHGAPAGK